MATAHRRRHPPLHRVPDCQTRFAFRLAAALSSPTNAAAPAANAAFSPLSLHVALSLLAAGAGGDTRDQLLAVLGGGGDEPASTVESLHALADRVVRLVLADGSGAGGPRVAFANAVFVDASLKMKPAFEQVAVGKYKAEARSVDFLTQAAQVAGEVNSWVEQVTSGLIKELLPRGSVNRNTRLVLANALYFKGAWTDKFDPEMTRNGEFHLLDGSSVEAPFMSTWSKQYIASYDNIKVLKLPYKQGCGDKRQFSMYILLPAAQDGLWSLAEKLSSEPELLERHILPMRKVQVGQFKIPKFKISSGFEASALLKGLGLQLPFSEEEADLSEFVDDSPVPAEKLSVSSIFHRSFVEVNEEGTEAAAASGVVMVSNSYSRPVDFVADHPFLFLIREDTTGVVLFVGHVVNPLLAA
ncbi:unnamed protein product [Urochloa decumbens]|uniref:Serpin domain-containing protein n=1 Tax=Urochloa decumbens TaxID=240449 RepID=A0ABC8Y0C1_9POAL